MRIICGKNTPSLAIAKYTRGTVITAECAALYIDTMIAEAMR